jgi:RNA polymerase sigma factor for flagellar operon FliA
MAATAPTVELDPQEEASLWAALRSDPEGLVRARLIETYVPFARMLAARLYAARGLETIEFGDYLQFAIVGLVECVDRFDARRGVRFRSYAGHRITGSVLNGLAVMTERQEQLACRRRMEQERQASLRDPQAPTEIAAVFDSLARVAVGIALGYMLEDSGMYREEEGASTDTSYRSTELLQLQRRLHAMVEALPERERSIVRYHYFQQVPFEAIAGMMGITKGRVSQLHRRAMDMLRDETRKVRKCDIAW